MAPRIEWTRFQRVVALGLYCELPFGKFHYRNPRIIEMANKINRTPDALAMKLSNIASLDPVITRSGRKGFNRIAKADRDLWQQFTEQPSIVMEEIAQALATLDGATEEIDHIIPEDLEPTDFHGESIATITTRRKSQNLFRKAVLSAYHYQCCITGVADPRLLVASHIKPWSQDESNRLNPGNGLCLSTFYDRAFDVGLISFDENYQLLVSPELIKQKDNTHIRETFLNRTGTSIRQPYKFSPSLVFLQWHRERLFIR